MAKDKSKKNKKQKKKAQRKAAKAQHQPSVVSPALRSMLVKEVAYTKAVARKFECTCCERDWLEAEQEVDAFLGR